MAPSNLIAYFILRNRFSLAHPKPLKTILLGCFDQATHFMALTSFISSFVLLGFHQIENLFHQISSFRKLTRTEFIENNFESFRLLDFRLYEAKAKAQ